MSEQERENELSHQVPVEKVSQEEAAARPANRLAIQLSQHWTIGGMTGSGKSYFATAVLEYLRRQNPHALRYFIDSTWDDKAIERIHAPLLIEGDTVPSPLKSPTYTQIWRPETDNVEHYNQFLMQILKARRAAIVVIDETASLTNNKKDFVLDGHVKIMKQGRKHKITIINETQELTNVLPTMFKQMTYFVQFHLNNDPAEWNKARRFLNILKEEQRPPSGEYGFFFRRVDKNFPAREYRSLYELFGQQFRF